MPTATSVSSVEEEKTSDFVKVSPPPSAFGAFGFEKPSMSREARKEPDVQGVVDETVKRVREQSDKLQAAAAPFANRTRDFAESRPVLFTFLTIFFAMSAIPIGCFAAFLISAAAFVLGTAAVGICISMSAVILLGASILIPVLMFTSFLSFLALSFLLSLFLLHRLYAHLSTAIVTPTGQADASYANLSKGVKSWLGETTSRVTVPFYSETIETTGSSAPLDKSMHGQRAITLKYVDPPARFSDDELKVMADYDRFVQSNRAATDLARNSYQPQRSVKAEPLGF